MPGDVRFVFIPEGHELPAPEDRDTNALYFAESAQQLYKGALLIADHIDIDDYLSEYKIKSVEIVGDAGYISAAQFDAESGQITLTQSSLIEAVHQICAEDSNLAHMQDIPRWHIVNE